MARLGPTKLASDRALFALARSGDEPARHELVRRFLPMARRLAGKFFNTAAEREDLIQVANLALVKAVERYDPDRGVAFVSFATPTIMGELKRFIRDTRWALRVPRSVQERSLALEAAASELEPTLGRAPTRVELAEYLGVTAEELAEAHDAALNRDVAEVDSLPVPTEDRGYELVEARVSVAPVVAELPEREREILQLRFGAELTQREIAERMGLSQMHVSRLIRRSLDELSSSLAA